MNIVVEEVFSPGCHICKEFEAWWETIKKDWPKVTYKRVDILMPEGQEMVQKYMIFASPGIIINGELFSTGGFSKEKFTAKLRELSAK